KFKDTQYTDLPVLKLFATARKHKKVIDIYLVNFLLQFFFSWMIIYTPIYLHEYVGFTWSQIAIIFSIMLLPFVILELPLGKIADRVLGEKELLVTGFSIMALTTAAMTFLHSANMVIWIGLLFISRIGAATVEIMSETYFFKQVSDIDVSL